MYKSKAKADQQVNLILAKARDDKEKLLKGYQLGNLCFQAKDYEQAKKYVASFLTVKEQYAPAHKLMAQIYERSAAREDLKKSINYYKRSYELDDSQKPLTLKICSIYLRIELPAEYASAVMYWIEKAKAFYPNDPVVFNLQEKLISESLSVASEDGQDDESVSSVVAMEELLIANLRARPLEVSVRLKLLKCLERSQKYDSVLTYIREVLEKSPYCESFDWYNYTANLLKFVTKSCDEDGWFMYLLSNFGAARMAIKDRPEKVAVDALQRLDQVLHSSLDLPGNLVSAVREELRSHQLLLAANLLSRRNADQSHISALYVAAFSQSVDSPGSARTRDEEHRTLFDMVDTLRAHRLVQTGYIILDKAPPSDQLNWLRKLSQKYYNNEGKKHLYTLVFGTIDSTAATSMLMSEPSLEQIQPVLPDSEDLVKLCVVAQSLYPNSLHHQTWLALRLADDNLRCYLLELIPHLIFSPHRLSQYESESVSQVDMCVFLLLTRHSANSKIQEHLTNQTATLRASDLTTLLCSDEQAQWWKAVYESCGHTPSNMSRFGRQRQLLSKGLQVVRLLDSHGLSVQMVCHMAQLLQSKLAQMKLLHTSPNSKVIHFSNWTKQYWTEGVKMLTILHRSQTLAQPREKMFLSYEEELQPEQVNELLAEGRLWIALQLCEEDREDEALQQLRDLPQPLASYTAAKIYKAKADACADPEDARQLLLSRTQECLHLTVDRLTADRHNPLNAAVEQDLERLEGEIDGHSASFLSAQESMSHGLNGNGSVTSTPNLGRNNGYRYSTRSARDSGNALNISDLATSLRVRPSPERLELQVRSLANAQETLRDTIHEERNIAMETSKQMVDTVTQMLDIRLKEMVDCTRKLADDMKSIQRDISDVKLSQQQMKGDMAELKVQVQVQASQSRVPPPAHTSNSDTQVNFLQQQLTALTALMATSLQHPALHPAAASLSGYGTPARGTPPTYQAGYTADAMQFGTYPHIPQQQQQPTPSRLPATPAGGGSKVGTGGLTQQEMEAAALAAAEHGYYDREYYVDDGENYYLEGDDYKEGEDYSAGGFVGAEGGNTIGYMPKTLTPGKPMPQPGFFAQQDKSQTKIPEPKLVETEVPPNIVMDKEMMNKEAAKQKPAGASQSPLVVNVPKLIAGSTTPSSATKPNVTQVKPVQPSPVKSDGTAELNDSSHDPHFEPIIELPPEVNVVTGEENEDVLFESRAKLFRIANKEWKDRGVGPVKILESKQCAGKCRVVMRRDQVHKVCANHAIHETMNLVPMGDKGNAWIWTATDYSEEAPTNESFAIRFKTPEIAADYKKAFDLAKEKVANLAGSSSATPVITKSDKPSCDKHSSGKPSLSDVFQPKIPQWKCGSCYLANDTKLARCPACNSPQPGVTEIKPTPAASSAAAFSAAVSTAATSSAATSSAATSSAAASSAATSSAAASSAATSQTPLSTGFANLGGFNFPKVTVGAAAPSTTICSPFATKSSVPPAQNMFGSGGLFSKQVSQSSTNDVTTSSSSGSGTSDSSTLSASSTVTTSSSTSSSATNLFGSESVESVTPAPAGIFCSKSGTTKPPVSKGTEDGGSLLRQLLNADSSAASAASQSAGKFTMGGFSFTGPPKLDTKDDAKAVTELATSKPILFPGFTGFSKPAVTTTAVTPVFGGFTRSTASSNSSSSPFTFTAPASNPAIFGSPARSLTTSKSDMKQSTSAPQLSAEKLTASPDHGSKDDSAIGSPTKGNLNIEDDCGAVFTPVIELPDLVEVSTGEEDEEKVFGERSKLFRMVEGQWKERGLGELKILRHRTKGTSRLVMRREQVLKLCANHKLVVGMKLALSGEKARIWAAQDFSQNEVRGETLCARFKTAELAQAFEKAFVEAVENDSSAADKKAAGVTLKEGKKVESSDTAVLTSMPAPSLSQMFKLAAGDWKCPLCAVKNSTDAAKCACCQTPNPDKKAATDLSTASTGLSTASTASTTPTLFSFTKHQFPTSSTSKTITDTPKPAEPLNLSKLSFGNFKLGQRTTPQNSLTTLNDLNRPSTTNVADEGSAAIVPESPGKYIEEEGEGDQIHFEPVIDLPDLVEVKTGEEDEEVLYVHRAKLFRFTKGEYKERGLGDVKILKHKTTEKVRLILRREKILKLACNHMITSDMSLRPMESAAGKAWLWYAVDFCEGTQAEEMFAIRFKTADIANEFKACFDAAKNNEIIPEQTIKSISMETPKKSRSRPPSESQSATITSSSPLKPVGNSSNTPVPSASSVSGSLFGNANTQRLTLTPSTQAPASIVFGTPVSTQSDTKTVFGNPAPKNLFGTALTNQLPSMTVFGGATPGQSPATTVFGGAAAGQSPATTVFGGAGAAQSPAAALFGSAASASTKSKIPVLGGKSTPGTLSQSLFGQHKVDLSTTPNISSGVTVTTTPQTGSVLFGKGLFDSSKDSTQSATTQSVFESATSTPSGKTSTTAPATLFGAKPSPQALFGGAGVRDSVFGGASKIAQQDEDTSGDVQFVCETKPSEELVRKAKEFLLPSGHFLYEKRKPCKGCIGCAENEDAILDHLFHNKPYHKNTGLSPPTKNTTTRIKPEAGEASGFAAYSSATDFSSLSAATSNPNAFQKTEGFKWSGAGKTLFGGASAGSDNANHDNPEAYEAEADFKPVLEVLPDIIDVKTGEEDEEKLFSHRAKFFRFDTATNQWKERGIGEMKLLKHPENGTVRVLLRREQVHKLVCNHLVQPEIELKPLATSETSWCWYASDFSDNSAEVDKVEHFAVRFKNIDLAKEFKGKFEEAKEFVKHSQQKKSEATASGGEQSIETMTSGGGGASTSGAAKYHDDDDEDDEDDDDDDDIKILYERQVTLLEKQGSQYQPLGIRSVRVVEETIDIIGGMAVYVVTDDTHLEYRQLIFQETQPALVERNTCSWQMYDFISERPHLKSFQAKFASAEAAKEFAAHIELGIAYAKEMQLHEVEAISTSMATNPVELHLNLSDPK